MAVVWLLSCDSIFGIEQGQPLPGSVEAGVDASVDSSLDSSLDSAAESSAPDTSGDAPPLCTGPIIYVAPTGSDSYPGCVHTAPKKTIGAAIAAASAVSTVTTIEVCRGTYNENPLLVTTATALKGGYSCGTWLRTANYGYPMFDNTNTTVIQNANVTLSGATLTVSGTGVTSAVVVDGFTIFGATSGTTSGPVPALVTASGAAPTISNNELTGGSLTAPAGNASIGVQVLSGSTPTITNNRINGGSGIIPVTSHEIGHASDGIFVDGTSTSVQILANAINGGSGVAANASAGGSVGIELLGVGMPGPSYTVRGNAIVGGTGTSMGAGATLGVYVGGTASLTLDSNSIDGEGGTTGVYCSTGVTSLATGALSITANRIYGGNCALSTPAPTFGLLITGPTTSTVVYNNMIHGGTSTNLTTFASAAILLYSVAGADIRHNTLVGGTMAGGVWLNTGTTGAKVVNNILAGSGADAGLVITVCPSPDAGLPSLAAFQNNLVFGTTQGLFKWNFGCAGATYATIDAMTAELLATETGAAVQGNVTLASTCGTDSGCIVSAGCTTPQTCLTTLFGGWDVASLGYKNLFPTAPFAGACPTKMAPPEGTGWTLAVTPLPPCAVTRSSLDDHGLTGLGVDLYGNCRTSTPSMGAEEDSSGSCQ
jgi:hypothetical protein